MEHSHGHGESLIGHRLVLSIFLTLAFVAGEAIAGYFAHSLALLSDAGHNFADALALIISWYGIWIARKPSTQKRTFGYHRVGILAALVNAVSLVVIALLIFWEAIVNAATVAKTLSHPLTPLNWRFTQNNKEICVSITVFLGTRSLISA